MAALSPIQLAKAASAYRALWRAGLFTFKNDPEIIMGFRLRSRQLLQAFVPSGLNTSLAEPNLTSSDVDEKIKEAFEVAEFLRKNVVQGIKNDTGSYALRITEETERGYNDSIKAPPPIVITESPSRARRRRQREAQEQESNATQSKCCGGH